MTAPTLTAIRAAYTGPAARTPLGVLKREAHHALTLLAAVDAVTNLHRPNDDGRVIWCEYCSDTCHVEWPCPTLQVMAAPFAPEVNA